jgi:hypothetical protein
LTGLEVSLRHLFQNGIIQGYVDYQLLQPGILFLQFLEPFCLLYTHTAVLFALPAVGLSDPDLPAGFANVSPLIWQDFNLAQLVDNLLRSEVLSDYSFPFLSF